MADLNIHSQIRARIEAFTEELADLIRQQAMEAVHDALGGGNGRTRKTAVAPGEHGGRRVGRGRGAKRNPEQIERLADGLFGYIKQHPGERIEQIARGMGTTTRELNLPVKKLVTHKRVRTKGQKRATQYFAR